MFQATVQRSSAAFKVRLIVKLVCHQILLILEFGICSSWGNMECRGRCSAAYVQATVQRTSVAVEARLMFELVFQSVRLILQIGPFSSWGQMTVREP